MLLDKDTINRIAAGEVIERPASVVKELLENAIDSGASSITIEIKDGGNLLIRVTDNGCGIDKSELKIAFLRHATSKIKTADDLMNIRSLGFRGEALSSISAIARTEIISKISTALAGTRYVIDGGCEGVFEEVAAPNGTTIIIRDIFFNTPARRKFLRTGSTEASHIIDLVEKIALSHPDIAIRLISNNQNKLQTMGNGNLKEIIYHIFGRDITSTLIPIDTTNESGDIKVKGFIAKPESSRSNRNYENYFINNRFIKSSLLNKAIEDGYSNFMMQHQYPFTVLMFEIVTSEIDINVHPTKMEIRFLKSNEIYEFTTSFISKALKNIQLIRNISLDKESDITISDTEIKHEDTTSNRHSKIPYIKSPEPFEVNRITKLHENESTYNYTKNNINTDDEPQQYEKFSEFMLNQKKDSQYEQVNLLSTITRPRHKLIGQAFSTYWIVELEDKLYIIDQHAAHEKVNYEKLIHQLTDNMVTSQLVNPPIILPYLISKLL